MNERIRQLAEQALKSSMVHDGVYRPEGYNNAVSKEFADKFAELIVKECMDVVAKKCASPTAYQALAEHWGVDDVAP